MAQSSQTLVAEAELSPRERARFNAAADYSAERGGLSLLIMRDGQIIYERYDNGHDVTQPARIYSGTKSFWGPLAMCMVEDGLVELDEPVWQTVLEWHSDPRKKRIRFWHLLAQCSGLDTGFYALNSTRVGHRYRYAVGLVCEMEPGEVFEYGPGHFYLLGEFIVRKLEYSTGETPLDYLKRRLLDPLNIEIAGWAHDEAGNPFMPSGAVMTARQWAKFGQFILDEGQTPEGEQLLPAEQLARVFEPSLTNPAYGLTWWLNNPVPDERSWQGYKLSEVPRAQGFEKDEAGNFWIAKDAPRDMVVAMGAQWQRLYVIPSLDMVIVRQGEGRQNFRDSEFLDLLLGLN